MKPANLRQRRNKKKIGEALSVLDVNAGNLSETARALNLPKSTLSSWRNNYANDPIVERYRTLKNEDLAERFRVVSAMAIERLQNEIDDVKVDNLMTLSATGADKQLLLTGQPTSINETVSSDLPSLYMKEAAQKGLILTREEAQARIEAQLRPESDEVPSTEAVN